MSVVSVSISEDHVFSKTAMTSITLVPGLGVQGDCHFGETVQHRSRLKIVPKPKNLRQVHLIGLETLQERNLKPGDIGENITTTGLDLLNMSAGTRLIFVRDEKALLTQDHKYPTVVLTGLRNPCPQIEKFRKGLQETFLVRDDERMIVARLAGVMSIVEIGGIVQAGMKIVIEQPSNHVRLGPV